jgi:hypothetical protein
VESDLDALEAILKLGDIAPKLLPQCKRGRVLRVGAANLDDILEFFALLPQRLNQLLKVRNQAFVDFKNGRHMHHGREAVVG